MSDRNHWTALRQRKISRRTMLGASAKAGVGVAGLALVGCGEDDAPAPVDTSAIDAAAGDASAAAAAAGEAAEAASRAASAAEAASAAAADTSAVDAAAAAAAQAASAAEAAAALAAEAAESEDAANAAAAAEAAAAAAADAAAAASAAGDQAAAAVAAAAAEAAEAAAQAARDVAAAVEAGTATAEAAQAAIDNAAEAAAAAAAAAGEASAAAGQAAATAQETAATAEAVAEAAAETAAAAVAAAEEAADAASEAAAAAGEAAESAAMVLAESQPVEGETDFNATVRIAVDTATGGLDPIRAGGVAVMPHYDTLGQFDQFSKEFVQSAATFEWVDDFTAGIVNMKPGMTFHDGAPLTAEDAKFTIDRVNGIGAYNDDGTAPSLYGWMVSAINDEVTVEGNLTVRVPFKTDASAFAVMGTGVRMTPKHIIEEIGDAGFANLGVGSGPFKLESFVDSDHVFSTRFEDYHVEAGSTHRVHKPWMARLEQYVRPEPLSRVAALEADEADMTLSLGWDLSQPFEDSDDFNVLFAAGTDNWNIVMNTHRPAADGTFPFQDIRVRRAVNHAVNWEAIIESRGGFERRNMGIAATNIGALTEQQRAELVMEYDPDKARALLAEAGYENGFHVPFWGYASRFAGIAEGGQAIAQDLEKVGITTDFQADEHAIFRPRLGAIGDDGIHEAAGFHHYFFNTYPDPVSNINAWISNDGSISHSKADPGSNIQSLVEATRAAFDPEERAKAINALQVAIYDEAMFLFGIEQVNVGVMRKSIEWINYGGRQDEFNYWGIRPTIT